MLFKIISRARSGARSAKTKSYVSFKETSMLYAESYLGSKELERLLQRSTNDEQS